MGWTTNKVRTECKPDASLQTQPEVAEHVYPVPLVDLPLPCRIVESLVSLLMIVNLRKCRDDDLAFLDNSLSCLFGNAVAVLDNGHRYVNLPTDISRTLMPF